MVNDPFNTQAMFERAFKPVERGYLFYPWRWSRGYLVTPKEFDRLKENSRQMTSRKTTWTVTGLVFGVILVVTLLDVTTSSRWGESPFFIYGVVALVGSYFLWKSHAPHRLVWGREPIAPRLKGKERLSEQARILSPSFLFLGMLVAALISVFGVSMIPSNPWLGIPIVLVFGTVLIENFRVLRFQHNGGA